MHLLFSVGGVAVRGEDYVPIDLAIGIDKHYVPHAAVMLKSLLMCNGAYTFKLSVVCDGVDEARRLEFANQFPQVEMTWYDLSEHPVLDFSGLLHITRATYLRLALPEILPQSQHRVLYLDADMVIDGDIRELWEMDLLGSPVAAAVDPGVDPSTFQADWRLPVQAPYFNAGVLLIDLKAVREGNYFGDAIEVLTTQREKCEFADQDALNVALWGTCLEISPKWNFQRKFMYHGFREWHCRVQNGVRPLIVHFNESEKPWKASEWHPWSWLYLRNLMRTGYFSEVSRANGIGHAAILKAFARWCVRRPMFIRGARSPRMAGHIS